ncbi:nuclease-related domain-containing protein [Ureibacillus composti]
MFDLFKKAIHTIGKQLRESSPFSTVSTYKEETGKGIFSAVSNKGSYGEFLSYKKLSTLPGYHKVLFNIYLPNGKGQTTEIDVVFLHETGVYVIESKNYSGWIFGNEKDMNWMQTFPNGKKYPFYNPIKQNAGHIRALQSILPSIDSGLYKSLIVFSERCSLKKVHHDSPNTYVMNRNHLKKIMTEEINSSSHQLEPEYIDKVYRFLSHYSKAEQIVKEQHVETIQSRK